MSEKTFVQLRLEAQGRGIPAAAKLRKADLQQRLYLEETGLPGSVLRLLSPRAKWQRLLRLGAR